jgi:hypothetical protein
MKAAMTLSTLCALGFINSASSQTLDCKSEAACPAFQSLLGTCSSRQSSEITCKSETKRIVSKGRPSTTTFAFYEPPAGYVFDPGTVRGVVSDGHGLHGVDASLTSDRRLYCLWGIGRGGDETGYCEVKARQITSQSDP